MLGIIEERFGTSDITALGGLAKSVPVLSGFFLAGGMASLGMPGMSGFISEFLAFLGLFQGKPVIAAVGVIGIILTAVYVLRATLQVTFGKKEWEAKSDIHGWEYISCYSAYRLYYCNWGNARTTRGSTSNYIENIGGEVGWI